MFVLKIGILFEMKIVPHFFIAEYLFENYAIVTWIDKNIVKHVG